MCSTLAYDTGTCYYALTYYLNVIASVLPLSYTQTNLVLINRRNGQRYQSVVALRAFFFFKKQGQHRMN